MNVVFLVAGLCLGAAHLSPHAWPLAWLGVALLAVGLQPGYAPGRRDLAARLLGLLVAGVVRAVVAAYWLIGTVAAFMKVPGYVAVALAVAAWIGTGVVAMLPVGVALAVFPRARAARWWLPLAWAAGEPLLAVVSGFSMHYWLVSQWRVPLVLRAVAHLGWAPALLACLHLGAAVGDLAATRDRRALASVAGALGVLALLPPVRSPRSLRGEVAALQMASLDEVPARGPAGVRLLVWPEASVRYWPRVDEGRVRGVRLDLPLRAPGVWHLVGLVVRTPRGHMNAAGLVDPDGGLVAVRGKRGRVPLGERPFLGFDAVGGGFVPGRAEPLLAAEDVGVVPLVCFEAFDRALAARGVDAGGDLVAVLASDRSLEIAVAQAQSVAGLVLRAVETHRPAVRAALGGRAAVVAADDRVGHLAPGRSGVLALRPDGACEVSR